MIDMGSQSSIQDSNGASYRGFFEHIIMTKAKLTVENKPTQAAIEEGRSV